MIQFMSGVVTGLLLFGAAVVLLIRQDIRQEAEEDAKAEQGEEPLGEYDVVMTRADWEELKAAKQYERHH